MSMKLGKKKLMVCSIIVAVLILAAWFALGCLKGDEGEASPDGVKSVETAAKNNAERVEYLQQWGWQVSEEPIEVSEIILPEVLDEVYIKYNEIQKKQGMDLENFCGRRAKRWTYKVLNYPNADEEIHANLIICDNTVIAGDICSVELGGFMHGLSPDECGAFLETDMPDAAQNEVVNDELQTENITDSQNGAAAEQIKEQESEKAAHSEDDNAEINENNIYSDETEEKPNMVDDETLDMLAAELERMLAEEDNL